MSELFSRRGMLDPNPDEYVYDEIPNPVRGHVFNAIRNTLHVYGDSMSRQVLSSSCEKLFEEYGTPYQKGSYEMHRHYESKFTELLEKTNPTEFIDFIDIIGKKTYGIFETWDDGVPIEIIGAFDKLNNYFRINKFGYQFVNGRLTRFDQTPVYDKITKPAFEILYNNKFKGAEDELGEAYKDYGKGENKDAILKAANAFESAMKTICQGMKYEEYTGKEAISGLVNILKNNNFIPNYLYTNLSGINSILSQGVGTLRNESSAHGQGATVTDADDEFVQFALNSAATNIIFLVRIYERRKGIL